MVSASLSCLWQVSPLWVLEMGLQGSNQHEIETTKFLLVNVGNGWLVGSIPTPLKNDGDRQLG